MDKGKFGLRLTTYAVVAFVLALLGQILLCGLLAGFVLVKEGDEKTARQCLTAFFASIAYGVLAIGAGLAMLLGGVLMSGISYRVREGFLGLCAVMLVLAAVVLVIFIIIGLAGAVKGKEANVPIFSALADKAFGYVRPRPQPAYPQAPGYPPHPPAGQGYYPPQPGQAPYAGPPQGYTQGYPAPPPAPPVPPAMAPQGPPPAPPAPSTQFDGDEKPGDGTKPGNADK